LAIAKREQAATHGIIAAHLERLEKPAIPGDDTASLVDHEQRLFERIYDPLRLDMFAAQQPIQVFQMHFVLYLNTKPKPTSQLGHSKSGFDHKPGYSAALKPKSFE
jgi:hypothetical protein